MPLTEPGLKRVRRARFCAVARLLGALGKFDSFAPYTWLSGSADFAGEPCRAVSGFGDARFRLSVNLYGAPALTMEEFPTYQQDVILGAALQVSVPRASTTTLAS